MIDPKGESVGSKMHRISRRLALYNAAMNEIDDYFEYRCSSTTDRAFVFGILTTLATNLREKTDGESPTTDD